MPAVQVTEIDVARLIRAALRLKSNIFQFPVLRLREYFRRCAVQYLGFPEEGNHAHYNEAVRSWNVRQGAIQWLFYTMVFASQNLGTSYSDQEKRIIRSGGEPNRDPH